VCTVLQRLAAMNIVHRDVRSANVLFDGARLVLTDFGFATPGGQEVDFAGSLETASDAILHTIEAETTKTKKWPRVTASTIDDGVGLLRMLALHQDASLQTAIHITRNNKNLRDQANMLLKSWKPYRIAPLLLSEMTLRELRWPVPLWLVHTCLVQHPHLLQLMQRWEPTDPVPRHLRVVAFVRDATEFLIMASSRAALGAALLPDPLEELDSQVAVLKKQFNQLSVSAPSSVVGAVRAFFDWIPPIIRSGPFPAAVPLLFHNLLELSLTSQTPSASSSSSALEPPLSSDLQDSFLRHMAAFYRSPLQPQLKLSAWFAPPEQLETLLLDLLPPPKQSVTVFLPLDHSKLYHLTLNELRDLNDGLAVTKRTHPLNFSRSLITFALTVCPFSTTVHYCSRSPHPVFLSVFLPL
jgi:serine/threonine protein kinase